MAINPTQIEQVKNQIEILNNQLTLCQDKIKGAPVIEPKNNTPEQERARLIAIVHSQKKKLPAITRQVETLGKNDLQAAQVIDSLKAVDNLFKSMKSDIAQIVEDQYEAKLEMYKQEIFKSIDIVLDPIDLLIPNIRHEIAFLDKHYNLPVNAENSILPELNELVEELEEGEISLNDFFTGYGSGENRKRGYNELRAHKDIFSVFQFYENSPEAYWPISACYTEFCKTVEPFLNEYRSELELGKFLYQIRDKSRTINRMGDIFEFNDFMHQVVKKSSRKYSYRKEVKKIKSILSQFGEMRKTLIVYNQDEINRQLTELRTKYIEEGEIRRLNEFWAEAQELMDDGRLPFKRLEHLFEKLRAKDFNIIIQEKDADDLTIAITPHHEQKYGRDILERINIIIQEIDFWYPPDTKQLLFQSLSKTTEKIQADEPVDKKEFLVLMQGYDREIEANIRATYADRVRELNNVFTAFQKSFFTKLDRDRLEKRLEDKGIWDLITPMLKIVNKNLSVLSSGNQPLKKNVNKFKFLKAASDEMCQLLYDLAMQYFVLFPGVEGKSITNMVNILTAFNEFHDVNALWSAFSHYHKKTSLPNLAVNEKVIIQMTQNSRCRAHLKELFPDD